MPFSTSAARKNGYYGKMVTDLNSGTKKFQALGKEIRLKSITENIETESVTWTLDFDFGGNTKTVEVSRKCIADYRTLLPELASQGADVAPKNASIILDTLRMQQERLEKRGAIQYTYERLGWFRSPKIKDYCYRGHNLKGPGNFNASYSGPYIVEPAGTFFDWQKGVIDEVLGHTVLEIVLLAGLAALVNGLIAPETTGENPIFHINGLSGTGKTTGCELAVSTAGAPVQGVTGEKLSLLCSWGATENAMIKRCEGIRGAIIAINEIGKFRAPDMTQIVYNLSEGTDKERLTSNLQARRSESYYTIFISTGETSLIDRCRTKAEGLWVRVMEITEPLTDNADHADRIKSFCHSNYGHAAPMLAQHIIDKGGLDYVLAVYEKQYESIVNLFPHTHFRNRFVKKFPALILTTAELASEAMDIDFNTDAILDYFKKHFEEQAGNNDRKSYDIIIEECRKNINCFYRPNTEAPRGKVYGKIRYWDKDMEDGRKLVEEYAVRKSYVDSILAYYGFQNKQTCIQEWKSDGVLAHDGDRPTRSRRIVPASKKLEDVYVFLVFADATEAVDEDDDDTDDMDEARKYEDIARKRERKPPTEQSKSIQELLADDDDDTEGGDGK